MGPVEARAAAGRRRGWPALLAVVAVLAVLALASVASGVLGGGGEDGWRQVEQGPFSPLTAGAPVDVEVEAGAGRAGSSGLLVLHNQSAEPVRLHAVEALDVGAGVEEVRIDGHWPDGGEEVTTAARLRPYPDGELVEIDGARIAPAGEPRSALRLAVGIKLARGHGSGSVGGLAVRFETATGRFEMHVDHNVSVVAGD